MKLTIYEVVSGGTKTRYPPGREDWCVLVAARDATQARDIAYRETGIGRPWVIYEWGLDARPTAKAGILRGPFEHCPAINHGWKAYVEDPDSDADPPPVIESKWLSA